MSIRLRLAVVFAVVSAALFALGGWLFVTVLSSSLMASIDAQLAAQATQASAYLSSSPPPSSPATEATNPPEYAIQLIDRSGRVQGASQEAGRGVILSSAELNRARHGEILVTQVRGGEHERVLAEPFTVRTGWVAVAAVSLESFDATLSRVGRGSPSAGRSSSSWPPWAPTPWRRRRSDRWSGSDVKSPRSPKAIPPRRWGSRGPEMRSPPWRKP